MKPFIPAYITTKKTGKLKEKIRAAFEILGSCTLCPRQCRVDRTRDEKGYCATGKTAEVASFAPHYGEEPQLVGDRGSGTIFFSHCSLQCVFCQNYDISIQGNGQAADADQIAAIMLFLQEKGCHNINFVTPTHVVPQILKALDIAIDQGLHLPLVYKGLRPYPCESYVPVPAHGRSRPICGPGSAPGCPGIQTGPADGKGNRPSADPVKRTYF